MSQPAPTVQGQYTAAARQHLCFIIHSHRPYCFDLNEILALPTGFRYRNRFNMQWLSPELRSELAVDHPGQSSLIGKKVLIVLRDIANNRLVPVRWGEIFNVESVGNVAFFEYHLSNLIRYDTADNVRMQEIVSHTSTLAANHSWLPGPVGQPMMEPSVFYSTIGSSLPTADADDLTFWGDAVAAVATAPAFARIEFLKIVGLFSASDGSRAPVVNESLVIRPNTVYQLKVFQQVPDPGPDPQQLPTHSVELNSFPDHIAALRANLQAVGKYDMLTFVVKVLNLGPGETTALEIPHTPDAATGGTARTSLYIPLTVEDLGKIRALSALALALIAVFFMFRPNIASLPEDLVRNVATVIFVLTLSGPSRALAGLWPSWPWKG